MQASVDSPLLLSRLALQIQVNGGGKSRRGILPKWRGETSNIVPTWRGSPRMLEEAAVTHGDPSNAVPADGACGATGGGILIFVGGG